MSNLNNVYGDSNSCPPIMNDGRGANTNFKPRNDYFQDIKNKTNSQTSLDLRKNLKLEDVKEPINEFLCTSDPDGSVNISSNVGGTLLTQGGSWKDNFKNLKN
jgi:hypothetical protein